MPRVINGITIPDDVTDRGLDTYGRTIWASDFEWRIWCNARWCLPFGDRLALAQSGWQILNGGGAAASAHYHDGAGPGDVSVRPLTDSERIQFVHWWRANVGPAWRRGAEFGQNMVDHIHFDNPAAPGWRYPGLDAQLREYLAGGDGLLGSTPDYEWRPSPLVTTPTREALMSLQDDVDKIVRKAIKEEVGPAVLKTPNAVTGGDPMPVGKQLQQTHYRAGQARDFAKTGVDPKTLASELAGELGPLVGGGVSEADLETALRNVLASLAQDS